MPQSLNLRLHFNSFLKGSSELDLVCIHITRQLRARPCMYSHHKAAPSSTLYVFTSHNTIYLRRHKTHIPTRTHKFPRQSLKPLLHFYLLLIRQFRAGPPLYRISPRHFMKQIWDFRYCLGTRFGLGMVGCVVSR